MIVKILDPLSLAENRFDIKIKYLYGRDLMAGLPNSIFRDIYKEHLRVWNGFFERNPLKIGFHDFDRFYKNLLTSIKGIGFCPERSVIPVNINTWYPLNGSHRIAACMVNNCPIYAEMVETPCIEYDEEYFREKGLSEEMISIVNSSSINNL